jgi:hypothetical protein
MHIKYISIDYLSNKVQSSLLTLSTILYTYDIYYDYGSTIAITILFLSYFFNKRYFICFRHTFITLGMNLLNLRSSPCSKRPCF